MADVSSGRMVADILAAQPPQEPSTIQKIANYLVTDSMPAKMVQSAYSGLTFPGDVMSGQADPYDYGRALDTAGMLTLGAGAVPKNPNELRMGAGILQAPTPTDHLENYAKNLGVDLSLGQRSNGDIILSKIVVPKELRGTGVGTDIMNQIIGTADQLGSTVALTPSSDFGGNKSRLVDFYKRFGFENNQGRNRDFGISETMRRYPTLKPGET